MAFTVTPTAGAGPYTFTAAFENKESLNADLYSLEIRPRTNVGSCPAPATSGTRASGAESQVLQFDSYTTTNEVPAGSCLVSTIVIRNTITDEIVSQASASVNNLE